MRSSPLSPKLRTPLALVAVLLVAGAVLAQTQPRGAPLDQARYGADGSLAFPADATGWVTLGASLGGDYAEGAFDPKNPGVFGVVQIEPSAYRQLRESGKYADGTMLLLTFYQAQAQSEPQLKGFVQGDVLSREIHVIDRGRFPEEGRAFFIFPGAVSQVGAKQPLGSRCVECHGEHAKLDATFAQFYPLIRDLIKRP